MSLQSLIEEFRSGHPAAWNFEVNTFGATGRHYFEFSQANLSAIRGALESQTAPTHVRVARNTRHP